MFDLIISNGCIVDSAFTINMDNSYQTILDASKDAVDNIVKTLGVDIKFSELSELSQEIVSSYEYDGKKLIKTIDGLIKVIDSR